MKRDSATEPSELDSKTAFERFTRFGEQLMRVPRDEVTALEKKTDARKRRKRAKRR
jgi:hypothetical protein